ncbi:MAG: N-acetyltransferase [Pseudomonadota bacterium]
MTLKASIVLEMSAHAASIDQLQQSEFGPGAFTRAAFRLREQGPHDLALSFVAVVDGALIGSVRLTPVATGSGHQGYLLGPLVVSGAWRNAGYGRALVDVGVQAAEAKGQGAYVILVGDAPYYGPLGFGVVTPGAVQLPGPVDPRRLLVRALGGFDPGMLAGPMRYDRR